MTVRRLTTTEGRQRLPDLIQQVYGEKCVIVFHRYGRDLAALVPLDMLPADARASASPSGPSVLPREQSKSTERREG